MAPKAAAQGKAANEIVQKYEAPAKVAGGTNNMIREDLKPLVVCRPSGFGEGTLIAKRMAEFPIQCGFFVSHTTRKPRNLEVDGVDYHFIERKAMEAQIKDGKFLEYVEISTERVLQGWNLYLIRGRDAFLTLMCKGHNRSKEVLWMLCSSSLVRCHLGSFRQGSVAGTETEEQVQKCLRNAKVEMERSSYTPLFNHMLINDRLGDAYKNFKDLLGICTTYAERDLTELI